MPLKTEQQYEDLFGDHIALVLGLDETNRNTYVRPMKQTDGTRAAERVGNFLVGLSPSTNWVAYHIMFDDSFEEPYVVEDESKIIAKRYILVDYAFYGPNAFNSLMQLKAMLYTQSSSNALISENIVYQNIEQDAIDLDELHGNQWYNKRVIKIRFLESIEIDNPSGPLEEVLDLKINLEKI